MLPLLFQRLRGVRQRDHENAAIVAIFLLHIQGVPSGDIAQRLHRSRSLISHTLTQRNFETNAFAWVGQTFPGRLTLYGCDFIPTAENGWNDQNYIGWCNPVADAAPTQLVGIITDVATASALCVYMTGR
ncbi:MAG: hypothetical protein ACK4SA_00900 [Caldilinea sp.]